MDLEYRPYNNSTVIITCHWSVITTTINMKEKHIRILFIISGKCYFYTSCRRANNFSIMAMLFKLLKICPLNVA